MKQNIIIERTQEGHQFSVYKQRSSNGRDVFVAKAILEDGEVVVLDHWNLAILRRRIQELSPLMKLARNLDMQSSASVLMSCGPN